MFHAKLHYLLFLTLIFLLPVQTRILYRPETAYVSWYFDYHLAFFVYLTDILVIACILAWFLFDRPKLRDIGSNMLIWSILAFIVIIIGSVFQVKHTGFGLYSMWKWAEMLCLLMYVPFAINSKSLLTPIIWVGFASAIIQGVIGWLQFHMQHMIGMGWLGEYISPMGTPGLSTIETMGGKIVRAYGTLPHPNILAVFLLLGLIFGLYLVSRESHNKYHVSLITTLIGLFIIQMGLFTTFSRLAWITGVLAVIAFIIFHLLAKQKKLALLILIPTIISCATIYTFYSNQLESRVIDHNSASISDRKYFNQLGMEIIKNHPVFGVGVGEYIPTLQETQKLQPWQHQPPHNIFIFVGAELGLLGLGLFVMILANVSLSLWRVELDTLIFSFSLLGLVFLLLSMFDHYFVTIQQGRLMFILALGLIAALPNLKKENYDV